MSDDAKRYHAGTLTYTKKGLAVLCLWLLWGDFCFTLMETVVPSLMPLKFRALGAPNAVMGLVIATIPGIVNAVLNPVVSVRSDRCRSRWGRRIPFIVATLPFLVLCLFGLGFGERMGFALQGHFGGLLGRFSPAAVAIVVLGAMMALFSFFNTFVNSVFWYLFNDVVPESLLARFLSWFRVVGFGAAGIYNLFVFKHAASHSTAILVGAGLLYFFGFGLMCFKVREGKYPPPAETEGEGLVARAVAAIRTYGRECLALPHYWYVFLASMGIVSAYTASMFTLFFNQSIGLSLEMIGRLAFTSSATLALAIPVVGWLADRFHPIRIVLVGVSLQLIVAPLSLVWLFWHPAPGTVFHVLFAANIVLFAPVTAMVSVLDPTLFMRLFPRERYGQFCSANSMLRSGAGIAAGLLIGVYLDLLTARWGADTAYRCLPLWNFAAYLVVFFALLRLYSTWKRYGGDAAYVPPLPAALSSGGSRGAGRPEAGTFGPAANVFPSP